MKTLEACGSHPQPRARGCSRAWCGSRCRGWGLWALLALFLYTGFGRAESLEAAPDVPEGAFAEAAAGGAGREPHAELRLLIDPVEAKPGDVVRVGVLFDLTPEWHLYWRFSGESGLPTELAWSVDAASGKTAQIGPIQWPAPRVFREADGFITTYGYSEQVLLGAELVVPQNVGPDQQLSVVADFLVCKVQCIPGRAELRRTLPIRGESRAADRATRRLFDEYAGRVPVSAERAGVRVEAIYSQSAIRPGDAFRAGVAVTGCTADDAESCDRYSAGTRPTSDSFVPDQVAGIQLKATGTRTHPTLDDGLVVTLEGTASNDPLPESARLRGVLALAGTRGPVYVDVDLPLPTAAADAPITQLDAAVAWFTPDPESPSSGSASLGLGRALLFALLGGLILNLMPCVFPVLAIKLFGVTELAHAGRPQAIGQGLAYAAGVLASMFALALVVIVLQSAGVAVGWGFQFQEPLFVLGVGAVLVVFALNLFGVFEIAPDLTRVSRVGESATGRARSFFEGLLAVVLATPCSAPFLGTAVGFAFASSAWVTLALFLTIGAGLAAPYVAVTLVPGLGRFLPRPGVWMLHLKTGLGFALLATVVWLLWILGRAVGTEGLTLALSFLLAVAALTWMFGALQASGRRTTARVVALASVASLVALGGVIPFEPPPAEASEDPTPAALSARTFDAEQIRASLAEGAPVFVYFTADWCLTCKVNERFVFADVDVRSELDALGFEVFVGDWTRRDETIRAELARFGRAAVPMYLVYSPEAPSEPQLLPELLTVDTLVQALRRAAADSERIAENKEGSPT